MEASTEKSLLCSVAERIVTVYSDNGEYLPGDPIPSGPVPPEPPGVFRMDMHTYEPCGSCQTPSYCRENKAACILRAGSTSKPTNPKDAIGCDKLPLHLWPETATVLGSLGLMDGALKYGRSNWRAAGVRASIYVDAIRRHLGRWFEGENLDPDSNLPHMAHVLACAAILVDAQAAGKLNDDRQYPGGFVKLLEEMTPHVAALKEKHADKELKHWTIADAPAAPDVDEACNDIAVEFATKDPHMMGAGDGKAKPWMPTKFEQRPRQQQKTSSVQWGSTGDWRPLEECDADPGQTIELCDPSGRVSRVLHDGSDLGKWGSSTERAGWAWRPVSEPSVAQVYVSNSWDVV